MKPSICFKCNQSVESTQNHYGLHPACFKAWFGVDKLLEFTNVSREPGVTPAMQSGQGIEQEYWNTSFFKGNFKKYSAKLAESEYILKIKEDLAPELPDVEFVCNQIVDSLAIPVAPFYLIDFQGSRCFVTRNFISEIKQAATLSHIYHYVDSGKDYNCECLMKIIQSQSKHYPDLENFIRVCLYDSLVGNHDRHGRNLGFIISAKINRLAPAYDNPSALGLEHGNMLKAQFEPKGKIFTSKSTEPTLQDYAKEFIRLDHHQIVQQFYAQINIEQIIILIEASTCSSLMKTALKKLIQRRYKELSDALRT